MSTKLADVASAILLVSATARGMPVSPLTPLRVFAFVLVVLGTSRHRVDQEGGVMVFAPAVSDTFCENPPVAALLVNPPSDHGAADQPSPDTETERVVMRVLLMRAGCHN